MNLVLLSAALGVFLGRLAVNLLIIAIMIPVKILSFCLGQNQR